MYFSLKDMKIYFSISCFFSIFLFSKLMCAQVDIECSEFRNNSEILLCDLKQQLNTLSPPEYLPRTDLITIVLPEYISSEKYLEAVESLFLQFSFQFDIERFYTTSFGPFQMQPQFIKDVLDNFPVAKMSDSILIKCKDGGYDAIVDNLNYLFRLEVQWEILRMFEKNSVKRFNIHDNIELQLMRLYNSGSLSKSELIFTKISCFKTTYENWCYIIKGWLSQ